ncbi:MAG: 7-cyano-7-deazaguanine synthase [Pirellulales bacterium]|nr:7-cyano-7-deazaguanine synthase [Pirellulales bacterium]
MITHKDALRQDRSTVGVLLSGGLDSSILVGQLLGEGRHVQPFFIRSGLIWQKAELSALCRFLDVLRERHIEDYAELAPLVVLDLPLEDLYNGHWSTTGHGTPQSDSEDRAVFLPGRNVLLVVKAAIWCQLHGVNELCLGLLGTSPFEDAGMDYFKNLQVIINCGVNNLGGDSEVQLKLPFASYNKVDLMRLGRDLPLELTFSCIAPKDGLHCGHCNKCAERIEAFAAAGMDDPTEYAAVWEQVEDRR